MEWTASVHHATAVPTFRRPSITTSIASRSPSSIQHPSNQLASRNLDTAAHKTRTVPPTLHPQLLPPPPRRLSLRESRRLASLSAANRDLHPEHHHLADRTTTTSPAETLHAPRPPERRPPRPTPTSLNVRGPETHPALEPQPHLPALLTRCHGFAPTRRNRDRDLRPFELGGRGTAAAATTLRAAAATGTGVEWWCGRDGGDGCE